MITVKHASKKALPALKALWKEAFGDSDEFIEIFFSEFYRPRKTYVLFDGKEAVSMLYYMDVKAKYCGKRLKCAYLYGVATRLAERRQGHFRRLHDKLIEDLRQKNYDAVLVMPADDTLFNMYKDLGYSISLKRFEYELLTSDIDQVEDPMTVWQAKKEIYKRSRTGLAVLESEAQFLESRRDHRFFKCGDSYLAFAPTPGGYTLYETVSPTGENPPVQQTHYERSAQLYDLNFIMDEEMLEKQKPQLSYLLN